MDDSVEAALWGAIYYGSPVIVIGFLLRMMLYRLPRYHNRSTVRLVLFLLFPTSLSVVLAPFFLPLTAQLVDDFMLLGFVSLPTLLTEALGTATVTALCRNRAENNRAEN